MEEEILIPRKVHLEEVLHAMQDIAHHWEGSYSNIETVDVIKNAQTITYDRGKGDVTVFFLDQDSRVYLITGNGRKIEFNGSSVKFHSVEVLNTVEISGDLNTTKIVETDFEIPTDESKQPSATMKYRDSNSESFVVYGHNSGTGNFVRSAKAVPLGDQKIFDDIEIIEDFNPVMVLRKAFLTSDQRSWIESGYTE